MQAKENATALDLAPGGEGTTFCLYLWPAVTTPVLFLRSEATINDFALDCASILH